MQFFRLEGFAADSKWCEENDNRLILRERIRSIALKTEVFNQKLQRKAFFFVSDASEEMVSIGILYCDGEALGKDVASYLDAIGMDLKDTVLEETTFATIRNMLVNACRNSYIESDDTVMERFHLEKLNGRMPRGVEYGEKLIEDARKKNIYNEAEKYLAIDTLIPELDRIYAGKAKTKALGHPVHYMVQTDDRETRKGLYGLLLKALHTNGRLRNRRYVYLDFKPGDCFSAAFYDCLYQSCIGGAVVVRYLANDDTEDDRATSAREIVEYLCETMKKYRNRVLTVFCLPRECSKAKELFYDNLGNTSFIELKEEFASGERAEQFLKAIARENKVRTDSKLFAKLEKDKGYVASDLHELFDAWYNEKLKTGIYPQYKEIVTAKKEIKKAAPKGSAYDELMTMVGLTEAKKVIVQALNYFKAQKLFADKGMTVERPAMHMMFTGNPGTAKTSVARLFAKIMKDNGLISRGELIEVGRGDLVGKYVGWTAQILQKKFREAQGNVLFVDEAYSLVDDRDGSFGDEAINTIVQEMENHRDDVVVILAGYPDKMEGLLQKNPGLRSRIAFHVPFADYNVEELCQIADWIAEKNGMHLADDACQKMRGIFEKARCEEDYGNGRYVRSFLEKVKMAHAERLLTMDFDSIRESDVTTIHAEDMEIPTAETTAAKRKIGFCV